jgi:hypothetical protein
MTLIVESKRYLLTTIYLSVTLRIILGLLSSYNCTNNYNNNDKLMIDAHIYMMHFQIYLPDNMI